MHTVSRIRNTKKNEGENERLFRVELELTSDNDKDLQVLTKHIREETFPNEREWNRLGEPKQVEEIYQILLQEQTNESNNGGLYAQLGDCKEGEAEYEEAIQFYKKYIEICEKYSGNALDLVISYDNIGKVYDKIEGEYAKALAIWQQSLPSDHSDLKTYKNNLDRLQNKLESRLLYINVQLVFHLLNGGSVFLCTVLRFLNIDENNFSCLCEGHDSLD